MDLLYLIGFLAIAIYNVESFGFRGFTYRGKKGPDPSKWKKNSLIKNRWITQPLDHFHIQDHRNWNMRYLENDEYFNGTGPIFIMLGGEWEIDEGLLQAGLMHKIGIEYGALMYYTEHRYYGYSRPVEDISTENLKYLNVDQALADAAYLIESVKQERNLKNTMVIVFGGSYGGNMAVWMRLKYPHLVQGALASSAPVYAKANFYEYFEVIADSLKRHSAKCVSEIKKAFKFLEKLISTEPGKRKIKDDLNLCNAPDTTNISALGTLIIFLIERFSGVVQYNEVVDEISGIDKLCEAMTDKRIGSPFQRLALLVKNDSCFEADYNGILNYFKITSWSDIPGDDRQWMFQTCTEYGYYLTTDSKKSIFGSLLTLEYFTQMCKDVFGDEYDQILLEKGIKRTNTMYGGKLPDVKNVLFVNGNVDPWHTLSVLEDLNESSPSILVDGASHCWDLNDEPTDVEEITKAKIREREIIGQWVKSWQIANKI